MRASCESRASVTGRRMKTVLPPVLATLAGFLRSRTLLHLEIHALRQQLAMVTASNPKRLRFRRRDRFFWVWLYRIWPGCLPTLVVFKAGTLVRWHRKGFRAYWTWKSRRQPSGRPPVEGQVRSLIRRMSRDNVGWGAPRMHAEAQMLGIDIAQATVAKYICDRKPLVGVVPAGSGREPPVPPGESTGMNKELPGQCAEACHGHVGNPS